MDPERFALQIISTLIKLTKSLGSINPVMINTVKTKIDLTLNKGEIGLMCKTKETRIVTLCTFCVAFLHKV